MNSLIIDDDELEIFTAWERSPVANINYHAKEIEDE